MLCFAYSFYVMSMIYRKSGCIIYLINVLNCFNSNQNKIIDKWRWCIYVFDLVFIMNHFRSIWECIYFRAHNNCQSLKLTEQSWTLNAITDREHHLNILFNWDFIYNVIEEPIGGRFIQLYIFIHFIYGIFHCNYGF